MEKKILILGTIILIVAISLFAIFSSGNSSSTSSSVKGSSYRAQVVKSQSQDQDQLPKPPDFTLPRYDDSGNINLASSYNEKPTVIQFWATWCEFCRKEFPVTNAMVATQNGRINFIAVNFSQESKQAVKSYIRELELDPSVLTFVMDEDGFVGRAYGVTGTPVHLFIKKGGEVSTFRIGYMSPQQMKEEIERILQ